MHIRSLTSRSFLLLVAVVTVVFLWTIASFLMPVFWAVVLSILFTPLFVRIRRAFGGRGTPASLVTLLAIFLLLVVPIVGIGLAVTNEAVTLYDRVASGELDLAAQVSQVEAMLPRLTRRAEAYNIDIDRVRTGVEQAALGVSRSLASQLLALGQSALTFTLLLVVTFYTLFFFLKDGERLVDRLVYVMPLGDVRERRLFSKFADVTRATIKGTFVVAIVQGTIGAVTFASLGLGAPILWGVTMGLMSLLPAIGAAAVWIPAALFLILSGALGKGLILVAVGAGIIGLVDNALRPVLVGRDAGIPDYVILLSTLGGIAAFGISGLVVGPVVAGLFLTVWEMFGEEFHELDAADPGLRADEAAEITSVALAAVAAEHAAEASGEASDAASAAADAASAAAEAAGAAARTAAGTAASAGAPADPPAIRPA